MVEGYKPFEGESSVREYGLNMLGKNFRRGLFLDIALVRDEIKRCFADFEFDEIRSGDPIGIRTIETYLREGYEIVEVFAADIFIDQEKTERVMGKQGVVILPIWHKGGLYRVVLRNVIGK